MQKLLPPWLDKRINNHFKKGGLGFQDKESLQNLVHLHPVERTPEQTAAIVTYLKKV